MLVTFNLKNKPKRNNLEIGYVDSVKRNIKSGQKKIYSLMKAAYLNNSIVCPPNYVDKNIYTKD